MKPTLQVKLSQHLTLTPQLQQSIRLLQLSTIELNQEIERMVQENPLLELEDSIGNDSIDYRNVMPEGLAESMPDVMEIAGESVPILSIEAETDVKQPLDEQEWLPDDNVFRHNRDDDDERDIPQQAAEPTSLRNHLNSQLSLSQI